MMNSSGRVVSVPSTTDRFFATRFHPHCAARTASTPATGTPLWSAHLVRTRRWPVLTSKGPLASRCRQQGHHHPPPLRSPASPGLSLDSRPARRSHSLAPFSSWVPARSLNSISIPPSAPYPKTPSPPRVSPFALDPRPGACPPLGFTPARCHRGPPPSATGRFPAVP